ncbi:MAG: 2-hydroxyacyl-CoA dehydratase [Syntrophobacterales bacterium]|nr:MAG: 2-hydroxyacyl-CoA dehydratase [Syntrophobacterales bacterium]
MSSSSTLGIGAEVGRIGFTTTIPIEILFAAGKIPVDLNNVFVTHPQKKALVEEAELEGFPRNICGWIKGIYAVTMRSGLDEVIAVTQGDCSNTQALMETLQLKGIKIFPFAYPYDRDEELLHLQIKKMMEHFGITEAAAGSIKRKLDKIRKRLALIDQLTWQAGTVSGFENHSYLVSASDMKGDLEAFQDEVEDFLKEAQGRVRSDPEIRLGYVGVPSIYDDLYPFIEELNARVVFNETQRQFSMPYRTTTLLQQYLRYTYPYDIFSRLRDIREEVQRRHIDGLIHYVQSFCFRQIEDLILRYSMDLPILTLEGDKPTSLDARTKVRIESFIELLKGKKEEDASKCVSE